MNWAFTLPSEFGVPETDIESFCEISDDEAETFFETGVSFVTKTILDPPSRSFSVRLVSFFEMTSPIRLLLPNCLAPLFPPG